METMILDATCGSKKIYQGWNNCDIDSWIGIDIRKGDYSFKFESNWAKTEVIIKPTILTDLKSLPFRNKIFNAIIFDPPYSTIHWQWYELKYGKAWKKPEVVKSLFTANIEFSRVLIDGGILLLKTMPKEFNLFKELLTNFKLILPIFTHLYKQKQSLEIREGALWTVGYKK